MGVVILVLKVIFRKLKVFDITYSVIEKLFHFSSNIRDNSGLRMTNHLSPKCSRIIKTKGEHRSSLPHVRARTALTFYIEYDRLVDLIDL